jgi:RES domain-containing protein
MLASKAYGRRWHQEQRSALLYVPSVVARFEWNILLNPAHPEFLKIEPDVRHQSVWWDTRLYTDHL